MKNLAFLYKLNVDIVKIAGGLERAVAKTNKGAVGFRIAILFHEPTR
jgi:hypothetical protein